MKIHILFSILLLFSSFVIGQNLENKQPASLQYQLDEVPTVIVPYTYQADTVSTTEPTALRAGYTFTLGEEIDKNGEWNQIHADLFVWRFAVSVENMGGLNCYFEDLKLQKGDELFIYNRDKSLIKGAFTEKDNDQYFVSDFIPGQDLIIEFNTDKPIKHLPFHIREIGVALPGSDRDFGDSKFCEVPVNCPEGDLWQNEKQGVARILVKVGNNLWWCSGSLVNNTKLDKTPYLLTANHCGQSASIADYNAWKFYFNYEAIDCEFPDDEPASVSLTGAKLLATSPNSTANGSDFKLLFLTDEIPDGFIPWFNGWDRTGDVSQNGVCIHHPEGDIKMISTYTETIVSTNYNNTTPDEDGYYWKVNWAETETNFGVTEGGSSGSPLFSSAGNIVGSLTGGQASCSAPEKPDYYGKFQASWESNGNDSTRQLKYWLDPMSTGTYALGGSNFDTSDFFASFSADSRKINLEESVQYINLSVGNITKYEWTFQGGEPSSYTGESPPLIRYDKAGNYDVKLKVSDIGKSTENLEKAYIQVTPTIYPNPSSGKTRINFGKGGTTVENLKIHAYDVSGREISFSTQQTDNQNSIIVDLSFQSSGMYLLRVTTDNKTQVIKAIVSK